jgi:hypothetical protein
MSASLPIQEQRVRSAPNARPDRTTLIAYGLFLATMLTRLPFQSAVLYHWDSVNFAYAIAGEFDVANGQPHAPGYLLYVMLARAVNLLFDDPQTTMVAISITASGLATAALYRLGAEMFNPATGLIAAALLVTSPLAWFYGEVALPHTPDLAMVVLTAWALYRVTRGDTRQVWWAALLLAVAGGFRPQTIAFLFPLAIFACRRAGRRFGLGALALFGVACLAWLMPLIEASGGLSRYQQIMAGYSAIFLSDTSIFMGAGLAGVARNLDKLIRYTLYGWGAGALLVAAWSFANLGRWRGIARDRRAWFGAAWAAPALAFYTLVHMGQQGLVFVFLPALMLASAAAANALRATLSPRAGSALIAASIGAGGLIFLFAPERPIPGGELKILTRQTIASSDASYRSRIDALRAGFQPERTLLIASDWRHAQFYLPEYRLIRFRVDPETGQAGALDDAEPAKRWSADDFGAQSFEVVLFDPELLAVAAGDFEYNSDTGLTVSRIETGQAFRVDRHEMVIEGK